MKAVALAALFTLALGARADLYKCVGKDGKTSYQAEPCDAGSGESRVRTPVGGTTSGAAAPAFKDGWDEDKSAPIISNCVRNAYQQGKRTYMAAGGDPAKLRDADLQQRLEAQCTCMMRRIMTTTSYADFNADPTGPLQRVSAEAANGGECRLDISGLGGR